MPGLVLKVTKTLYEGVRRRCHEEGVYASGVMRVLAWLYVTGNLTESQVERIMAEAKAKRGKAGRGWTESIFLKQEAKDGNG